MRYRVLHEVNDYVQGYFDLFVPSTGIHSHAWSHIDASYGRHVNMTDDPHPGYFQRKKRGELILGAMVMVDSEYSSGTGSFFATGGSPVNQLSSAVGSVTSILNNQCGQISFSGQMPIVLDVEAIKLKALAKIDAGTFDVTEDILSYREFFKMIRHPLEGIDDILRAASKRRFVTSYVKLWNYTRFGVTPFIQTLHNLYEAHMVDSVTIKPFVRLRSTASGGDMLSSSQSVTRTNGYGHQATYAWNKNSTRKVRAEVFYHVTRPRAGLAQKLSFRPKDLPAGFWNLIPLSFMVDRVYSVNNLIEAIVNLSDPTVVVEGGCVTETTTFWDQLTCTNYVMPGWTVSVNGDTLTEKNKTISRTLWTPTLDNLPTPQVSTKKLLKDATNITDLCTLILGRFRRFK